jgi:opacity protein-like surface antigen
MAKAALIRSTCRVALTGPVSLCFCGAALSKDASDSDDEPAKAASTPNLYLDLRTYYTTVPAGSLSLGFGNSALFATLPTLATLSALTTLPTLPTLSSPASRRIGVDVPLTVDFNDRVSVYGGFSASASRTDLSDWSALTVNSWMVGFQADVYQQNGGSIPTITLQSTLTRSVPDAPLPTTALNTILEFDYALNTDETQGLLAGVQYTRVAVNSAIVTINPDIVGYVGGYYQWDNNWKLSGRFGVQSFGGAQLLNLTPFQPFTQPLVRLDLDRMDDNDNRLFGVTAQISWMPKPSYQLTVRTPLYAVRN